MSTQPMHPAFGAVRLSVALLAASLLTPVFAQQATPANAEKAAPASDEAKAKKTAELQKAVAKDEKVSEPAKPSEIPSDDTYKLSPFNVTTSKDQGYFAENTLAGSRLNTNLSDLAASITVVTKQQMDDTASVDINDVFKFEANTEGSSSYTPVVTDRGSAKDTIAGYSLGNDGSTTTNAQSNRVRGLAAPDASINYYPTNSRIPFDSYNTQSVEISRGPNSLLFGLGSPAGIVNQSTAQAVLNRNTNTASLRVDQHGSYRGSYAFNRSLLRDKLAIYGAVLYNNQQFQRKPSYDLTRRQYMAFTYKPFKKTVLRAFAENYQNNANRPNSLTPRDYVTPWLQAGRPSYDPIARTITNMNTGVVTGPYVFSTLSPGWATGMLTSASNLTSTTSSQYVPGITWYNVSRPLMRINNGTLVDFFQRQPTLARTAWTNPAQTAPTPANQGWTAQSANYAILDRQWTQSTGYYIPTVSMNGTTYTQGTYNYAGVTDKSIYDWTKYNTLQSNFGRSRASNYNIELEQEILPNLFFSAGWFRQDIDSASNYTSNQLTGATLAIDTNTKNVDGTTNAYYGLPYIEDYTPDTFYNPETDDNYRAMLTYDFDLSKRDGWLGWLGRHRLIGVWSKQNADLRVERWRMNFYTVGGAAMYRYLPNPYLSDGFNRWNNSSGYLQRNYYMANPGDAQAKVSHSTGYWGNAGWNSPYATTVKVYDYTTSSWVNYPISMTTFFADNGSYTSQRRLKSYNFAAQSYFWQNRLVTTLGWRHDDFKVRKSTTGAITDAAGNTVAAALTSTQIYDSSTGYVMNPDYLMTRWNRWDELSGDTKTLGAAFRPFQGWSSIERRANNGSQLFDFVRSVTFYANYSDNFNPPSTFQTDFTFKSLPKPTGEGKELGIGFNLMENKLVARVNWFETKSQDERTSAASTLMTRLLYGDTTLMYWWADAVVRIRNGISPTSTTWKSETLTTSQISQIWALMGLPTNYYSGMSAGATQDSKATGWEVNLTYNPTRNWTMKLTGAKQVTTYKNIAPQFDEWYAVRKKVWDAAVATDIADFVDANNVSYSLSNFWSSYGYTSAARLSNTDGNTTAKKYFDNTVLSQYGLAKALEGAVSANQRKYRASFLTNYNFTSGKLRGFAVGGSERWESRAAVGYMGKAADPTLPTTLNAYDITKPVYFDNGNFYTDLWVSYTRKVFNDKIRMKIQLNCQNVTEDGHLEPIAVNYDGKAYAYRIIDSRQFQLTTTFDF